MASFSLKRKLSELPERNKTASQFAEMLMHDDTDDDLSSLEDSDTNDDDSDILYELNQDSDESDAEPEPIPVTSGLLAEEDSEASDMEQSSSDGVDEDGDENVRSEDDAVVSNTGLEWKKYAPASRRRGPQDIIRTKQGLSPVGRNVQSIADCFKLFITPDIVQLTVQHSNEEGERVVSKYNEKHPENHKSFVPFTEQEVYACIGILILLGVMKGKHENYRDMWSQTSGRAPFIATLSCNRFQFFVCLCRFDDRETREMRKESDNMAHIRELFDMFNDTLTIPYYPSECLTVDEQLVSFRGRAKFKIYIPSKPGKYGLLLRMMTDASSRYVLNIIPYAGRPKTGDRELPGAAQRIVHQLVAPYKGTGRNVTMDRFYTSVTLAEELLKDKLTITGTMNTSRREIPGIMKAAKTREEKSSIFLFTQDLTMVSYVPKKNKSVILLSSMHHTCDISTEEHKKPEIIMFYNSTKGGVDTVDQMVRYYSCRIKTRRWPLVLFMNCIDIAAVNAFVIWLTKNPMWNTKKTHKRRLFLQELGLQLIRPHVEQRAKQSSLRSHVKIALASVLGHPVHTAVDDVRSSTGTTRGRCFLCVRETHGEGHKKMKDKVRRQQQRCAKCYKHVCNGHCVTRKVCADCNMAADANEDE